MRNRRGLSTVVGAVFFVIAATTVISYISYSMNSIDQFSQSIIVAETENVNRGMEDITVSQITIVNGEFNMTVVNTGSLPIHLTRLWVTDLDSAVPDKKADLDVRINPGNEKYNIGQGTGISADSTISYSLKAVTERGNIVTFSVSPDVSTQVQLIAPANAGTTENFRIMALITNNSTTPNNIANLVPILKTNTTLTQVDGPLPPSVQTLPQGNTATFTWTFQAPKDPTGISFNVTYAGAPSSALTWSNTTISKSFEAEGAGTSEWSQAAKRVGLLISGVPNPVEGSGASYWGKWGIGIINPLDRPVEIYSVGILAAVSDPFWQTPTEVEPADGNWRHETLGTQGIIIWEGGATPIIIPAKDVGQFRVETKFKVTGTEEIMVLIQALTSEGKMTTIYTLTGNPTHPTINTFYTSDISDPLNNWSYMIRGIQGGTVGQVFNATVQNAADNILTSKVKLLVLIPSDFTNVQDVGGPGWDAASVVKNPDDSHIITVDTTSPFMLGETHLTYQFSADVPSESETKLFVFQTTTIYPSFIGSGKIELASALSEAGVQVIP